MLYTHAHIYTLHIYAHIYICLLETLEQARKNKEERRLLVVSSTSKTNVGLMETFRGCCLSRRREAKVLREDSIHKHLQDRMVFTLRTNHCQAIWSTACLKVLLKDIDSCCQLMKLLYKPALFDLLSFFQVIQQVLILTRLWLTGQSHLMLFDTIEQEFCTTSEIKTMNHWDFALLSKGRQYKRGDLHRCHKRENKWHRLYLAQDSLCLFFLLQTTSSQGKLPSPIANTYRRLRCRPEPHGARHRPNRTGRWLPSHRAYKPPCSV